MNHTSKNIKSILFFNWKDINHPAAGGAEVVTHEICKRLIQNGFKVCLITARYHGSTHQDSIDGVEVIRVGKSRLGHYFLASWYYFRNLRNTYDSIVEEVNTLPYLVGLFKGKERFHLFYHQLAREIWFLEMVQPLSFLGYAVVEPVLTWIQSRLSNSVITVSSSSKKDLLRFGFKDSQVDIISEGIENAPLVSLQDSLRKEEVFTILFHSSLRPMKRPLEVLQAFRVFINTEKCTCNLWFSGGGDQSMLRKYVVKHGLEQYVTFFGRTSEAKKFELMQRAHVLCSTSIKEGWGLIVTEANSMGTPAIVYDVDGLRDAGKAGGGAIVDPDYYKLATEIGNYYAMVKQDPRTYNKKRIIALNSAKKITFEQSYNDFVGILKK